jgi:gliding motility-associated-like protein
MKYGLLICCFFTLIAKSQVCILTNQINFNTGFDNTTNNVLSIGMNDPRWIIDNANNIPGAVNLSPAVLCNPAGGAASNVNSAWIGFATTSSYVTNNPTVGFYLITFRMPFRTCADDSLLFNFNIANDNYISALRIDGITTSFNQPVSSINTNWMNFSPFNYIGFFLTGNHTIEIDVQNFNVANAVNPHQLNVYGTINSLNNSIVSYTSPANCICNAAPQDSVIANFNFSYPTTCDSSTIQFNDLSSAFNSTIVSWEWYFGDGNSSTLQNPIHSYTGGGSFLVSLIVTSNTNQKDTFYQSVISIENSMIVNAIASNSAVCFGNPVTLTGSGATTYTWTGGVTNGVAFVPSSTTTYTVTGTNANGCSNTSSVTVNVGSSLPVSITPLDPILCIGDSILLTANGATNYNWNVAPGLNTYTGASVWANPTSPTTYMVTGTDANGCSGTASVDVDVITDIDITVSKNRDAECNLITIQLQANGAQNYNWTPANLLSSPTSAITNATVSQTTTFYVSGSTGSCTDVDSIVVYNYNNDETGIFIPNAFSPNGDGNNDCLHVRHNANFKEYYFAIYNRWGERVFESDNPSDCWNGEYKNKVTESGTFYYYLKAETSCGKILKKGDITLVR